MMAECLTRFIKRNNSRKAVGPIERQVGGRRGKCTGTLSRALPLTTGDVMEFIATNGLGTVLSTQGKTMSVIENITIFHRLGLHLRSGAELARVAKQFKCEVYVSNGDRRVNAKSLLELLTLGALYGTVLEFSAEGEDASAAIQAIRDLIYSWKKNG